jgi:hypothetical protein
MFMLSRNVGVAATDGSPASSFIRVHPAPSPTVPLTVCLYVNQNEFTGSRNL